MHGGKVNEMNAKCNNKDGFYPHYIKRVDENFYLYNVITNGIFLLEQQEYDILISDTRIEDIQNDDIKKFLEDNFIIITEENKKYLEKLYQKAVLKKKSMNATSLTLMISQACNLRCKYCYGDGGEYSNMGYMTYEVAKNAVDFFVSNTEEQKLNICFFGGEPLLNFELIKKVVEYAANIGKMNNREFTYSMTTNATLITPEIEQFIKENKFSVTVSMDGTRRTNDANRYYANKIGAYNDINSKTVNLKNNITVRATVAPPNLDVDENLKHIIEDLKYKRVAWAEADNLLSGLDYEILCEFTMKLYDRLEKMIKDGNIKEVKKYHSFINILKKFNHDGIRSKGCGSGTNMMAVDIDGKIYPCHRFVGLDEAVLGNVSCREITNTEFYSQVELSKFEKCKTCLARSVCGGGCINENYFASGYINEPSENHCKFRVKTVDRLLELFIHMSEEEKKLLLE